MNSNQQKTSTISLKQSAVIAALGLLLMAILAPIANFHLLQGLIDKNNIEITVANLMAHNTLFRTGIALFLVVAVLDIIVAWALYIFLVPVNKYLSLLTAWLRLVYAAVLVVALFNLIQVTQLLSGNIAGLSTDQIGTQVMLAISAFNRGWEFGLIIFGLHLLLLGYLFLKAGYMRKILGILLLIAGAGYIIDGFGRLLSSDYSISIGMFTFMGEVVLIFWLFVTGRKIEDMV
jgi:hypothetical protein